MNTYTEREKVLLEAIEALKPFAALAIDGPPSATAWNGQGSESLTLGDFRRASRAIDWYESTNLANADGRK